MLNRNRSFIIRRCRPFKKNHFFLSKNDFKRLDQGRFLLDITVYIRFGKFSVKKYFAKKFPMKFSYDIFLWNFEIFLWNFRMQFSYVIFVWNFPMTYSYEICLWNFPLKFSREIFLWNFRMKFLFFGKCREDQKSKTLDFLCSNFMNKKDKNSKFYSTQQPTVIFHIFYWPVP